MRDNWTQKEGGKWLFLLYPKYRQTSLAYAPLKSVTFSYKLGDAEYIMELAQTAKLFWTTYDYNTKSQVSKNDKFTGQYEL